MSSLTLIIIAMLLNVLSMMLLIISQSNKKDWL